MLIISGAEREREREREHWGGLMKGTGRWSWSQRSSTGPFFGGDVIIGPCFFLSLSFIIIKD
jgi:hypothetical protein